MSLYGGEVQFVNIWVCGLTFPSPSMCTSTACFPWLLQGLVSCTAINHRLCYEPAVKITILPIFNYGVRTRSVQMKQLYGVQFIRN